ncbi:hypothetical protein [Parapedobacter sp. 10938]|uniref:hypothetical protein n=1 Tax=Parapedobacter flavus TaxID=3110225 RepID=UPI002DBAAB39|nr:hypothetical protein [Parapedobacter sp. 10938]MEC3881490.1 hypothetical protein [Parapedobacter sp. 10938]
MKPTHLISLLALGILLFARCEKAETPDLLTQRWVDSFEEASDGYTIFRPSHYKDFPLSRFRQTFELRDDRACSYLVLAPNDAHYVNEGVWEYNGETNTVKIRHGKTIIYNFQIIKLAHDLLKVKML